MQTFVPESNHGKKFANLERPNEPYEAGIIPCKNRDEVRS
jgi:hypothetical protein